MNEDQKVALVAIDGSINKWKGIIGGFIMDEGDLNCPLFIEYNNDDDEDNDYCLSCPIYLKTKEKVCRNTPYDSFDEDKFDWKKRANRELSFLYEIRLWWINRCNKGD